MKSIWQASQNPPVTLFCRGSQLPATNRNQKKQKNEKKKKKRKEPHVGLGHAFLSKFFSESLLFFTKPRCLPLFFSPDILV